MTIMEYKRHNMFTMQRLSCMSMEIKAIRSEVFKVVQMDDERLAEARRRITESVAGEDKFFRIRAEIFAILYVCQPEALFAKVRFTDSVVRYIRTQMPRMSMANFSKIKTSIAFLYFNDRHFKEVADRAVAAVVGEGGE